MKNRNSLLERFDRSIAGGTWKQLMWFAAFVMGLLALFITYAHFRNLAIFEHNVNLTDKVQGVIYHFFDPGNQSIEREQSLELQIFTFIVSLSGIIFLGGMLISTLINTVERRVQKIEQGLVVYKSLKNHYIIIGYGEMIISLIEEIFERAMPNYRDNSDRKAVREQLPRILIMTNQNIAMVRSEIHSQIMHDVEDKIVLYAGNIESVEHLENLNLHTAVEVYITGEKDEYGRDTKNIACVKQVAMLYGKHFKAQEFTLPDNISTEQRALLLAHMKKRMLKVNVQFDRIPSYSIAQKVDLPKSFLAAVGHSEPCVDYRPFNFHENWSRLLWSYYTDPKDGYSLLNFEKMEDEKYVHLVIVGLNRMGRALLLEALRICHYTNFDTATGRGKTKITVVDMAMEEKLPFFKAQYPYIESQIEDIKVEFLNVKIEHQEIREIIKNAALDKSALLTVAICIKDPDIGLTTGLNLPEEVYFQSDCVSYKTEINQQGESYKYIDNSRMRPRVLIRQELHQGLSEVLNNDSVRYRNVKVFGMLNKGFSYELLDDKLAQEVGNNYRKLVGSYNNGSNREVLSENFKWANRYQIDMYGYYMEVLAQSGITSMADIALVDRDEDTLSQSELLQKDKIDEVLQLLSEVEHRRWMAERTVSGWRQYNKDRGETRMDEYQIHTLIVPNNSLDDTDKAKDYSVIKNVLEMEAIFKKSRNQY